MAKKTVLVRVVEWSAWLPQEKDVSSSLMMSHGITGFEAEEAERLVDLAVSGVGQSRHIPMKDENDNPVNIRHGLYAFQAVLASQAPADEPVPESPVPEGAEGQAVVLPGSQNRKTRREGKKRSG